MTFKSEITIITSPYILQQCPYCCNICTVGLSHIQRAAIPNYTDFSNKVKFQVLLLTK